jgi:prepilin-type N-terminal cleavage/methylation domain-containing protein
LKYLDNYLLLNDKEMIKKNKGFTLIELLIVIAIIAILVSVVFVALNPLELFAESRNAQRWVKTSELLTAIHVYTIQNDGNLPNENDWQEDVTYVLGTALSGCSSNCAATSTYNVCLDLDDLVNDKRISQIPQDPEDGTSINTGFYVYRDSGSIITVGICNPELDKVIELTR